MPRDNRGEQYFWINPDHPAYKVRKDGADISQKTLDSILKTQAEVPKDTLNKAYEDYSAKKSNSSSRFHKLVEKELRRRRNDVDPMATNKESFVSGAAHAVNDRLNSEIDRFFANDGPYAKKITDQHLKNIAEGRKSAKAEKNIVKKVVKKARYAGGIDWKSDGADIFKDVWDKHKKKVGAGLAMGAGIAVGKKLLDAQKNKLINKTDEVAKKGVRKYYDAKRRKNDEDQEKKAMIIPEDQRTNTEKNIRSFAETAIPIIASVPGAIAATALTTAGGEILRQRKREKQRAKWEEEDRERGVANGRRHYDSNYRGRQKYQGSKPYIQGKERSRHS